MYECVLVGLALELGGNNLGLLMDDVCAKGCRDSAMYQVSDLEIEHLLER